MRKWALFTDNYVSDGNKWQRKRSPYHRKVCLCGSVEIPSVYVVRFHIIGAKEKNCDKADKESKG